MVLVINSSPRDAEISFSKHLTQRLAAKLTKNTGEVKVIDLASDVPTLIDKEWIRASMRGEVSPVLAYSDRAIKDWKEHKIIVIGAPMFNLGPTAHLKAYIDQLIRYNVTFESAREMPDPAVLPYKGLLSSDHLVLIVACMSWDFKPGSTMANKDFLTPWLAAVLDVVGIHKVYPVIIDGIEEVEYLLKTREQLYKEADALFDQLISALRVKGEL
eukprot:Blabericola_migrator_1__8596@NODE_44_length_16877_cov_133_659726_g40_i0_p5_GENE_NODE_44_length_16877_cov_133_659726_g40_i0NODE_44_length_16877_cov_133_659726_g40_i0_p5_ORF_typecomplete_len215_score50_18Flavodoxin_2/PF02525_17/1_1e29FMN_red/PF03358_15/3_4e10Flavodoxin_5/PF12724_7/0_01Dziplike_N/PF13815_6/6_3e03Dziplike_N/PF13815_6/2e02Dziplike_N/PF13815_6/5_2_NODE_44_length_16877_cov_133_659726_g40_i01221012854